MHTKVFTLCAALIALGLPLDATEQTLNVTPKTLDGWVLTDADKPAIAAESSLSLPAGAQLSRQFAGSAVLLHLVTQPEFSAEATEWPIAGVGPVALALVRNGAEGRLVLVIDQTKAIEIPWSIPLGEKSTPIEFILAYAPTSGTVLVSLQDNLKVFDVSPSAKPTEVLLAAGEKSAWSFDLLQVVLLGADTGQAAKVSSADTASGNQTMSSQLKVAVDRLLAPDGAGVISGAVVSGTSSTLATKPVPTLELFTPAPVRRVQILNTIRKAVANR